MLRKLLWIVVGCCWALSAQAILQGTYIGANFGYELQKRASNVSSTFNGYIASMQENNYSQGVRAGALLGYGFKVDDAIVLGFELHASLNRPTQTQSINLTDPLNNSVTIDFSNKQKYAYTADVKPGFMLNNNTIVFLDLGFSRSRFEAISNVTAAGATTTLVNRNTSLNGLEYGLGVDTNIGENLDLRFEFLQTSYASMALLNQANITWGDKPTTNEFNVNLIYNIGHW